MIVRDSLEELKRLLDIERGMLSAIYYKYTKEVLSWSRGKQDHICFKKESFSEEWSRIEGFTADVTA